ncbi:MAG: CDP-alcohol phosphatidyltransferase family protein [Candidatus Omnitrophica bacterium]|nr:CDP-alcohol phosphatidyltransferase family protein [Candidatus Omnitrophota bacterium]
MNIANKITILRILLIPFFISFILYSKWEMALFVFVIASISDGIDGYIARATKQRTELGKILDPIADKILILSAFICLSVAKDLSPAVKPPPYVPIVIISRDAIIVLGVLIIYFIKGHLETKPTLVSKITTFSQMVTVVSILARLAISPLLWNITVLLTVYSGLDYVIKGTRILNEK